MYKYESSVCLKKTTGSQWHETKINGTIVYLLYSVYRKIILVLSNPVLEKKVYVDMDELKNEFGWYNGTIEDMLESIGNRTLPTIPELPNTNIKYVKYSNAVQAAYKINRTKIGVNLPFNYPSEELIDLVITRPKYDTDISLLFSHCLLSVNGYYHNTDYNKENVYIVDGAKSLDICGTNHVGITSFLDIGKLTRIKLKEDDISLIDNALPKQAKVQFKVDLDVANKSFLLILGGYMIRPQEGVFWQSGENVFTLDMNRIPYPERLMESENFIDNSSLKLIKDTDALELGDNAYDLDQIYGEEVIRKYFQLSQSFFVVIDKPSILTNINKVQTSKLPGYITVYDSPTQPLVVGYGRLAEYWKKKEGNRWLVKVTDSVMRNYVINSDSKVNLSIVNNHYLSNFPIRESYGAFLEMSGHELY